MRSRDAGRSEVGGPAGPAGRHGKRDVPGDGALVSVLEAEARVEAELAAARRDARQAVETAEAEARACADRFEASLERERSALREKLEAEAEAEKRAARRRAEAEAAHYRDVDDDTVRTLGRALAGRLARDEGPA